MRHAIIVFTLTLIALSVMYGMKANAQENWVRCKYTLDGSIQSFPGQSCPPSWYPI